MGRFEQWTKSGPTLTSRESFQAIGTAVVVLVVIVLVDQLLSSTPAKVVAYVLAVVVAGLGMRFVRKLA